MADVRTSEVHSVKQQLCGIASCAAALAKGEIFRGLRLCSSCRDLLGTRLTSLPQLYQASEEMLEVPRQHSMRAVRGRRPAGIHLDDNTLTMRSTTVAVLSSWCELIVAERGVAGPESLDVRALAAFLRAQLDWLATHAAAADFAEEIAGLVRSARKVLNPARSQMIDLAPCPRNGCGRMVRASIGAVQHRSVTQVCCDAGHTWPPREWLRLSRLLEQANDDSRA
jgi:hypothetical protein